MVYKSGRLHVAIRKFSMSNLTHDCKILNFQTAVLAEPSAHNSPNLCSGFGELVFVEGKILRILAGTARVVKPNSF